MPEPQRGEVRLRRCGRLAELPGLGDRAWRVRADRMGRLSASTLPALRRRSPACALRAARRQDRYSDGLLAARPAGAGKVLAPSFVFSRASSERVTHFVERCSQPITDILVFY